jgi:hypothetical protein
MQIKSLVSLFLLLCCIVAFAQPVEKLVKIVVAPDHSDWVYKPGENAKFRISVLKNSEPVQNVTLRYEFGPEMMAPSKRDSAFLKDGQFLVDAGSMNEAGFLRCKVSVMVNGSRYENLATAAFSPGQIKPTTEMPADFESFWNTAKTEASKVPLDAKMILLPERCTEKVNVYHTNIQNYKTGMRLYGILSVPKKPGKYPALLRVPGAGVRG